MPPLLWMFIKRLHSVKRARSLWQFFRLEEKPVQFTEGDSMQGSHYCSRVGYYILQWRIPEPPPNQSFDFLLATHKCKVMYYHELLDSLDFRCVNYSFFQMADSVLQRCAHLNFQKISEITWKILLFSPEYSYFCLLSLCTLILIQKPNQEKKCAKIFKKRYIELHVTECVGIDLFHWTLRTKRLGVKQFFVTQNWVIGLTFEGLTIDADFYVETLCA